MESWRELERTILAVSRESERRFDYVVAILSHTAIAITLIIAYVVITTTGGDGTSLLYVVGAYLLGAGVQKVTQQKKGNP